mmetsp:Transcript_2704/g.3700  ORF Transcript_2704/g.3700 Transcript_2704/m.3700 type:complete len:285 (-) Transcript_2704:573-1427(-)|eukprot:CAMPEP_0197291158 /NCGR_PEP_ID=MMETSP0890-20130614/11709_1 /TAXON_ID=44058 ORGANISM="Aureoumbra lagunensis, Strain CCMP1510" /NCGR_SAMPLE_ID=MMETSP0890 /ASSEMBLY_ACC=CAM_ASM_000533 /LENGTH=284 /DNA_ID=CAMNT_0042763775 /DNA_START=51 /DNA_END=905 /DNA_ORIENTATION=+
MGVKPPDINREDVKAVYSSSMNVKSQVESAQLALSALRKLKKNRRVTVSPVTTVSPEYNLNKWYLSDDTSKLLDEHETDINIGLKNGLRFWDGADLVEESDDLVGLYKTVSDWEGSSDSSFESDSELEDSDSDDDYEEEEDPDKSKIGEQKELPQVFDFEDKGEDAIEIHFFRMEYDPYETIESHDKPASLWAAYEELDNSQVDAPSFLAPALPDPYDLAIDEAIDAPVSLEQHYVEIIEERDEPALLTSEAVDDLFVGSGYDFMYKVPKNGLDSPMLLRPFCF